MAKVYFKRIVDQGEAISPLNQETSKWFTIELMTKNGVMRKTVKTNFWERELDVPAVEALKEGALFGEGVIVTEAVAGGYDIGGTVVNSITMFVAEGTSISAALAKKGIVADVSEKAGAELVD
jgi:hypothetical protein